MGGCVGYNILFFFSTFFVMSPQSLDDTELTHFKTLHISLPADVSNSDRLASSAGPDPAALLGSTWFGQACLSLHLG